MTCVGCRLTGRCNRPPSAAERPIRYKDRLETPALYSFQRRSLFS